MVELENLQITSFLESVKQTSIFCEDINPLGDEFFSGIESGRVNIQTNSLIREIRYQNRSLDGKLTIFIPESFSKNWHGGDIRKAIISMIFDTVSDLRQLSGPSMNDFYNLKRKALSRY